MKRTWSLAPACACPSRVERRRAAAVGDARGALAATASRNRAGGPGWTRARGTAARRRRARSRRSRGRRARSAARPRRAAPRRAAATRAARSRSPRGRRARPSPGARRRRSPAPRQRDRAARPAGRRRGRSNRALSFQPWFARPRRIRARVVDEAVAVRVAVAVDPRHRGARARGQISSMNAQSPVRRAVRAGQHDEQRRRVDAAVVVARTAPRRAAAISPRASRA